MTGLRGMALADGLTLAAAGAWAQEAIKIGILHALSGTMAISETTLKDTMLMLIARQNARGGVLGRQLEAVVVDPAVKWPLFAEKARELLAVSNDVGAVRNAMYGLEVPNLTGNIAKMLPNQHLTKPVLIGEIRADGQFDITSQTEPVPGDARTDYLPESAVPEADWPDLGCGMHKTATKTCVQIKSNH